MSVLGPALSNRYSDHGSLCQVRVAETPPHPPPAHVLLQLIMWLLLNRMSLHWGANLGLDLSQKTREQKSRVSEAFWALPVIAALRQALSGRTS